MQRPTRDPAQILEAMAGLAAAVADARDREAVLAAADRAADAAIGHRLFTIMAFDAEAMEVERLYSSNPQAYPPGGRKKKRDTEWGRKVLELGEPYIGRSADDIRANFIDHAIILGLGLESILNMPVSVGGRVIGTVNLLHGPAYYDDADLATAHLLATLLAGALRCQTRRV